MKDTTLIIRRICLPSRFIDSDIKMHLLNEISKKVEEECTKDYGHILSVEKITKIISHTISRSNCDNVFIVEFKAITLKPEIGMGVSGTVCMVYKDGIFINIFDKQKLLIPFSLMNDECKFDPINNMYFRKDKCIKVGDELEAKITAIQFNNKSFSCIGMFKDL
tara:strand:- start:103 stop:594 length:492 start_codon:yes stop_codon:yes gene_type:complete